jgi:signal transduction histidine kinase
MVESIVNEPEAGRRLQDRYEEIAQLAGGLAHEIRNPLSTMRLNLDLLAEEFHEPGDNRERRVLQKIERVRRETHRLEDLLESFLRFARVQALKLEPTDLDAVVEELRDFIEPRAVTQVVRVWTQFADESTVVPLDIELFRQALLNLVLNALHAMPDGGELILTTRREEGAVALEVTDTGTGIPEEVQAKVFDPFFSTRPGGSGLGLPTTRKIVEAHGGTIELQSAPGKGSRFIVRVPLVAVRLTGDSRPGEA